MTDKKIILFDGLCNFCSFWVQFAFKRNKKRDLFYMSLQDERATELLAPHNFNPSTLSSVVFLSDGKIYTQSTAALMICKHLDGAWKAISLLLVIPTFIRDFLYNFVARHRYKWFGKTAVCFIPTPEMKRQFL
jgi:predicted DCC family thiol-disulfide oxidoreductase YuxK